MAEAAQQAQSYVRKKRIRNLLKVLISLSLGIGLILYIYFDLTEEDKATIAQYFRRADYRWVGLSMLFATLSHMSRAWRWKYPLRSLDLRPRFWNSFFSVMIGYIVNLALPRAGEISRCASLARYEQMPFEKLLGTVIAERIADLIMLAVITLTVILLQYDLLNTLLDRDLTDMGLAAQGQSTLREMLARKFSHVPTLLGILVLLGGMGLGAIWLIRKSSHPLATRIRKIIQGLWEGVYSIISMKQKWYFILHTLFIWWMYIMMFYVVVFSLEGVQEVPISGILAAFVMGGFSMVLVQGGLGAFPVMVMLTLLLYGIDQNLGLAFGWIMWTGQTLLVLLLGLLSFILIPIYNQKPKPVPAAP